MSELNNRRLEIDALRVLWAVRNHGGITRASEALGLSQSAVSHKIKRLETSLDCDILSRKPGASMFTAAGEDLLDYAERILGLHDEALLSLTKTAIAGRISLGLTEDTTCTDLARILGRFRRLHPQVSVRTKVRMSLVLRAMLERGELDAAIVQVFAHEVRPTDILLFREKLHWVRNGDFVVPQEGPVPFLSFDDACFYRTWALDIAQDGDLLLETVFECSSAAGIVAAVISGLGVALLNERHLRPDMVIVTRQLPVPPDLAYVVRRSRKVRNPALDTLVAEIENEISRYGGLTLAS
ncbi:LysR family transcriptional regulator [Neorhizobium alkalisoli]|uniref:DNA-binding transcriptional LysR family regulator n=1 Tax=Neorhizobium alkalisoli TaxID=528178 RepID=A0A561QX68_9HYPH|nr:LysR family transcriptional regulator [Neorhizobium alkalisoli]TWF54966.1 DNA-binding transcriptional LysR family regulator [Neorhizobium alkalisoli]